MSWLVVFKSVAISGRPTNCQLIADNLFDKRAKNRLGMLVTGCRCCSVDVSLSLFNKVLIAFVVLIAIFILLGGTSYPGLIGG